MTLGIASPASADDDLLHSKVSRKLGLLKALTTATNSPLACQKLAELSQAVPPSAVLSRLAFSRKTGRWELTLSQGARADAEAIVARLVTSGLCSSPSIGVEGAVLTASCAAPEKLVTTQLALADRPRPVPAEEGTALAKAEQESQSMLPDVADLESLALIAPDLAAKNMVEGFTWKAGSPIPGAIVDRFELTAIGSGSFVSAAGFVCELANLRRLTSIDAFEMQRPRVRNGEWVIDFTVAASTWRYRREDEQKVTSVAFSTADVPKFKPLDIVRTRSPFGPPTPVFAGAARVLTGKECLKEGTATPLGTAELDSYVVAFVALPKTPCAMLVDAQGGCHEVRIAQQVGPFKLTHIKPTGLTLTRYASQATLDGTIVRHEVALKAPQVAPPPWFCRAK